MLGRTRVTGKTRYPFLNRVLWSPQLANRLSEEQINTAVAAFFGEQGAWYTVRWKMCVEIEKAFGRRALIEVMCDPRKVLPTYNRAAARLTRRRESRCRFGRLR
jgi:hypothetical protein